MTSQSSDLACRFGMNVIRARRRAGLSQEELGYRADLHRTEISGLERGLRVPRIDTAAKIAAATQAPIEELFEGIVWRPGELRRGGFEVQEVAPAPLDKGGDRPPPS